MSEQDASTPIGERQKRAATSPLEKDSRPIDKRLCDLAHSATAIATIEAGGGGVVTSVESDGETGTSASGVHGRVAPACLDQATIRAIADAVAAQIRPQIASELAELRGEVQRLRGELAARDKAIAELREDFETKLDASEQYSRRSSVRVFNIPETKGESTDDIICRLGEAVGADIFLEDIDRSHRVGRKEEDKNRPIICKFVSYQAKIALMRKKKKLKGINTKTVFNAEKIFINEDLTKARAKLAKKMRDVKEAGRILDTWTRDGVIFVKTPSEEIKRITCEADLRVLDL